MWGRYHWGVHRQNSYDRRRENEGFAFSQDTWFVHDKNRDLEWSYLELTQDMTVAQALDIFDLFEKDPMTESLTYDEVKGINRELIYDQLNEI